MMPSARRDNLCRRATAAVFAAVLGLFGTTARADVHGPDFGPSAIVFTYQRFGDDQFPATSIRLEQFEAHLEELTTGGYTVLPLPEIVEAVAARRPLPDRAVALTIGGNHRSVYDEAFPRLQKAGLPFTLFIASDFVDGGGPSALGWREIRAMAQAGATIGSLGASHPHVLALTPEQYAADVDRSLARIQAETGTRPTLFAYPYGEVTPAVRAAVAILGLKAAFGEQSGVVHPGADPYMLPRFALNEAFGSIERFRLAADSLPLPVSEVTPEDPVIRAANPPPVGFTVDPALESLEGLACFVSGQGRVEVDRLDSRIEVRLNEPLPPGRSRLNCTLPAGEGRWRWFGYQFVVPEAAP
ncbi:MAG TPA: polysaccharide deacetylase family protein [Alphaproteobacteria bacterium]|nr:polysaccharide deacetylase family protein [Alphaproteobacteria bacterium]